nr:hypothetical protein [Micromonospora sp. DSM 115978]
MRSSGSIIHRRLLASGEVGARECHTELIRLCIDGFARLVTDYGKYDQWVDLVADARERGLAYLERLIRDVESDPPDGVG